MTAKLKNVINGITIVGHNGKVSLKHDNKLMGAIMPGGAFPFKQPGFHVSLTLSGIRFDEKGNPQKDAFDIKRDSSKDTNKVFRFKKDAIAYAIEILTKMCPAPEIENEQ